MILQVQFEDYCCVEDKGTPNFDLRSLKRTDNRNQETRVCYKSFYRIKKFCNSSTHKWTKKPAETI